jgi:hypothetical protein
MTNKPYLMTVLLLLAFLTGACNYPGYSKVPAQSSATSSLPDSGQDQTPVNPDCASGLVPGRWVGSVSSSTTASSVGFRVVNQIASMPLQLEITCSGDITGSASREGSGEIRVPFMLDGTCTENAKYQVSGSVLSDNPSSPILRLTFNTLEGRLSCNLDSSISSIPSGEQSKDLAEASFTVDLVPDSFGSAQISGSQWPDSFYQDQLSGMQEVMDEYDIVTQTTASWVLNLQQ